MLFPCCNNLHWKDVESKSKINFKFKEKQLKFKVDFKILSHYFACCLRAIAFFFFFLNLLGLALNKSMWMTCLIHFCCLLVNLVAGICTTTTRNLLFMILDNVILAQAGLEKEKPPGTEEQCLLPIMSWKSTPHTFPTPSLSCPSLDCSLGENYPMISTCGLMGRSIHVLGASLVLWFYSHFPMRLILLSPPTDEKNEAQWAYMTCLKSHS